MRFVRGEVHLDFHDLPANARTVVIPTRAAGCHAKNCRRVAYPRRQGEGYTHRTRCNSSSHRNGGSEDIGTFSQETDAPIDAEETLLGPSRQFLRRTERKHSIQPGR